MPDSTAQSPATRRPRPDPGRVEDLVREHWGLPVTATHPLPSHKDFNTRIDTPEGPAAVLKIYAPDESPDVIDLELAVLERLAARAPDLPVPRPLPTLDGQLTLRVDLPGQGAHRARLLSWLPGEPLAGARPRGVDPAEALGRLLGRLDAALADFDHPGAHRESFVWELSQAPGILREGAERVTRPGGRGLVERALADFETYVAPRADDLPRQVVHNDANDHNVLLAPPDASPRPVVGLLDFGDCTHTWRVAEVAIAAAYAALGESRPERIVATLAAAYHGQQPLTDAELAVLHTLVRARLAVSVCLSAAARAEEPDEPYLTVSEAPAWEALERLGAIHDRFAEGLYRHACGRPPPPAWVAVASWLGEHAAAGASPLDGAADPSAMLVLDLSVDSPDVDDLDALADARGWTRRIERQLDEAGARAGVGRYDEVRLCYTSPSFATGEDDGERRTVHLGVDLFAPAGTPVRAPLDGRVVWRADNARPLDYGPTVLLEHGPPGGPRFFTLYGHLSRDSLAGLRARQTVRRGEAFAALGDVSENGGWPPHLHFQVLADHLDATGDFPGVAAPSERQVWLALCPDPALLIPLPPGSRAPRAPGVDELMRARRARIAPALSVSYRKPLHIVRGWRQHLYDADGQAYLDGVNNVCHVGHAHPRVVAAARRQMGVLNTNTRYLHPALLTYAERLAATLPDPLEVCFFVNSGSEANELALRLAFTATGRSDVVVLEGAYHGNTGRAVEISPYKFDGPGGRGAPPWVHVAPMPDPFRGACADEPDPGAAYAAALGDVVRAAADAGRPVAAFIHESILSCGGQIVPPAGFLPRAYEAVREAGGLCIADEVQVGFGRVGDAFWGFEIQGVVPDIVTLGKPIGNGHPLGAVVTTRAVADVFANGMEYFNTFGGNPVSCAVGLAVLDVIEDEGLQERARVLGARLLDGLRALRRDHPGVADVRGAGLFVGIEFSRPERPREPDAEVARYVVERARSRGVLLSTDGPDHNVIKIKPPLVLDERDVGRIVGVVADALDDDFPRSR